MPHPGEAVAALPAEAVSKVAEQAAVSPRETADEIAQTLSRAVDRLTPGGEPVPGRAPPRKI
ncbi:YidB family protein [Kitasatospora sp. GAS204B]|uniref:YidB family protein n=1 Tax=unclassified Kitasatospora TaxID=2633591 RepID=UPI002475874D|nr:YidB family protein [Kitasatospora sp. GAS204B]